MLNAYYVDILTINWPILLTGTKIVFYNLDDHYYEPMLVIASPDKDVSYRKIIFYQRDVNY